MTIATDAPATDATTEVSPTGRYTLDTSHSRLGFVARHAMVTKVRGAFTDFAGEGTFDAEHPEASTISLTIQAASIDTGNADRDAHLRTNDFFAMDEFPTLTFTSTSVARLDDEDYRVEGDLTIKGITKPVTVDFTFTGSATDVFGNHRIGFEGRTTINRKDWGVTWNAPLEAGGVMVGEKIVLELDVSGIRADD